MLIPTSLRNPRGISPARSPTPMSHCTIYRLCVSNAVKSKLLEEVTSKKEYPNKTARMVHFPTQSGKMVDNFVVYPKEYTTWNKHFSSTFSNDFTQKATKEKCHCS